MTAPPMSRAEQALLLADTARRRRLTPDEAALLRRRIRELADRAGGASGGTGPRTGLSARVSDEQAPHAPVPIRARDGHTGAQTAHAPQETQ